MTPDTGAGYRVRPAEEGDLPAILELLRTGLEGNRHLRTEAFWRWKHRHNPFGPSPVLVAVAGGRLVGLRAFLRWRFRSAERTVEAVRAVDTVTHPAWRGRGVFTRLTLELVDRVADEGVAFVFNTPNRRSRAGYLRMGWRDVVRVPVGVKVRRPLALAGAAVADLLPGLRRRSDVPAAPELEAFPPVGELLRDPCARRLVRPAGGEERLQTLRSPELLAWRYRDVPGIAYRALWRSSGDDAAALIFRSRPRRRLGEIDVAEVLTGPSAAGVELASELLRELSRRAPAHHLVAVAAAPTPEREALRGAGFLTVPAIGPRLTVRPLTPARPEDAGTGLPSPTAWASWRCSLGDLEIF